MWERVFLSRARPVEEFEAVTELVRQGLSDYEIARRTSIPRSTVLNWRSRSTRPGIRSVDPHIEQPREWRPISPAAYAYLFGLYLGDGWIAESHGSTPRLGLALDTTYPRIIGAALQAIEATLPGVRVRRHQRPGCVILIARHPVWPYAFPQHGPGKKHTRPITLADWQRRITAKHPCELVRGLIHSDGSRVVNRFGTRLPSGRGAEYAYPRYFFTNYSSDIRRIFCEHCDLLGVRWTQSSFKNISVARRDSVAIMDSFVGPKR